MGTCQWASCNKPAHIAEDGFSFCHSHILLHRRLTAEDRGEISNGRPRNGEQRGKFPTGDSYHAAFLRELRNIPDPAKHTSEVA